MLTGLLKKTFSHFITPALVIVVGFALLPPPLHAQELSIPLAAPTLRVELLKPNGNFNQKPTICKENQHLANYFLPADALLLVEARCKKLLLDGATESINKFPLAQSLGFKDSGINPQSIAQSLTEIKTVDHKYIQDETGKSFVTVNVELKALYPNLSEALKEGVADFEYLSLISLALDMEQKALAKIEKKLANASSNDKNTPLSLLNEFNTLKALQLFRQGLTPPKKTTSINKTQSKAVQIKQLMSQAAKLDPSNPLVFYMMGYNQLKSAHSAKAITSFTQALKLSPELTPALLGRGTAYLRLNLLDLALADYNKAIKLNAEQASYFMARASVWLIKEDYKSMCKDFIVACSKGECEGYRWAVERGYCE